MDKRPFVPPSMLRKFLSIRRLSHHSPNLGQGYVFACLQTIQLAQGAPQVIIHSAEARTRFTASPWLGCTLRLSASPIGLLAGGATAQCPYKAGVRKPLECANPNRNVATLYCLSSSPAPKALVYHRSFVQWVRHHASCIWVYVRLIIRPVGLLCLVASVTVLLLRFPASRIAAVFFFGGRLSRS
ncbi:hypothetical protein B0H19DRAFT_1253714 [Mycena capillaripes]|nr:hypothetical protein B0H19DRAFT_1253714 [Mycena capillaripes]